MRAEIKALTKSQLSGRWGGAIGAFLMFTIIGGAVGFITNFLPGIPGLLAGVVISYVISGIMTVGISKYALNFTEGRDDFSDIFFGFKFAGKAAGIFVLQMLIVLVGTFLFIIPGIIAGLMLSQSFFVLADDCNKGVIECLTDSKNMMKGRLLEFFVLQLSFIGWGILAVLTLGIGYLFFIPYQYITMANYFNRIKQENVGAQDFY